MSGDLFQIVELLFHSPSTPDYTWRVYSEKDEIARVGNRKVDHVSFPHSRSLGWKWPRMRGKEKLSFQ